MRSALFWDFTQCRMVTAVPVHPIGPVCLTLEDWSDTLSRNVGNKLTFYPAQNLKRAQISMKRGLGVPQSQYKRRDVETIELRISYRLFSNLNTDIDSSKQFIFWKILSIISCLEAHLNSLLEPLLQTTCNTRRLKRCWPLELQGT
jgi:hypothetical protein